MRVERRRFFLSFYLQNAQPDNNFKVTQTPFVGYQIMLSSCQVHENDYGFNDLK